MPGRMKSARLAMLPADLLDALQVEDLVIPVRSTRPTLTTVAPAILDARPRSLESCELLAEAPKPTG